MIRANRPIRSRQDYFAASADPSRATLGTADGNPMVQFGYWRSRRSVDEMRRRPEALRTGAGNFRRIGMGTPYVSGMGNPAIEREDFLTGTTTSEGEQQQQHDTAVTAEEIARRTQRLGTERA